MVMFGFLKMDNEAENIFVDFKQIHYLKERRRKMWLYMALGVAFALLNVILYQLSGF